MTSNGIRRIAAAALMLLASIAIPSALHAQSDAAVPPDKLTKQPKLASPTAAAAAITRAYPASLRNAGVGGVVTIEFVVNPDGSVDRASIDVVASTAPALAEAAKKVAEKLEFKPGEVNGEPVRARVLLPLTFKAG